MKKLTQAELDSIQDNINSDESLRNVYAMLHIFRDWERSHDLKQEMRVRCINVDELASIINKKYIVTERKK